MLHLSAALLWLIKTGVNHVIQVPNICQVIYDIGHGSQDGSAPFATKLLSELMGKDLKLSRLARALAPWAVFIGSLKR
ncbi:hypothetical protein [Piscirickettsia salmonis]|uniref:hypothetical protein n=1 Tax=Piscirickettsia salmonis TaxID=1238 RepID=UPI001EE42354|nr:hypothetical protein [Piscirickettsia salmonis]